MYVNKSAFRMVRLYYCQTLIPNSSKRWATCTTVKDMSLGITSFAACMERWMLLLNAAEGKMVMCSPLLQCTSIL